MLEPVRYACDNWLINPAALAVGETPPANIGEQRFQLVLTGVAVLAFQGTPGETGWWIKNSIHIMPAVDPALAFAIGHYAIPTPPGDVGNQYTRHIQVEQMAAHVGLASVEGKGDDLAHEIGYACDAWREHQFDTLTDAFTQAPLPRIFTGVDADLAAWRGHNLIHRVNYHVTLLGRVRFAAVIIT
jgi:hypothetical protein